MTYEHIAIIALLSLQAVTLIILWRTHLDRRMVPQGMAARQCRIALTGSATDCCAIP
jgi:hypothetical protein